MFSIGLTGGIGSGKSLAAEVFASCGAAVVDTDAIARDLTGPQGAAIEPIRRAFGSGFIDGQGALDRAAMRRHAFAHPRQRRRLEAILHPLIRAAAAAQAERAAARAPYVVIAVPLLVESGGWRDRVDRVLVVDTPAATQIARVAGSRGLDPPEVERIVSQQARREDRIAAADDVLFNDGARDLLAARVRRLHGFYVRCARRGR